MEIDPNDRRRLSTRTLESGAVVAGRYVIDGLLGEGGMGRVYLAIQKPMDRKVALKVIRADQDQSEDTLKRFFREALVISKLKHPNTITLFDYGENDDGSLFIAMEYLEGISLTDLMALQGRLDLQRTVRIVAQIGLSLAEAHRKGIIHRDLKPDNVFLMDIEGQPDFVKVIDFGIAHLKQAGRSTRITRTGSVCGTPEYMSPEQGRGDPIDRRTDFYSLGVMMFEMLEGQLPYLGETPFAVAIKHQTSPVPMLSRSFPRPLRRFVARLMAKSPDDRPESAESLLHELKDALPSNISLGPVVLSSVSSPRQRFNAGRSPSKPLDTDELAQTLAASTPATKPAKAARRKPWRALAASLVILLGVVAFLLVGRPYWDHPVGEELAVNDDGPRLSAGSSTPGALGPLGASHEGPGLESATSETEISDGLDPTSAASVDLPAVATVDLSTTLPVPSAESAGDPGGKPNIELPSPVGQASPVNVLVASDPPGAEAFIDNRLMGLTPVTLEFEPGQVVQLLLRHDGYEEYRTTLEVDPSAQNFGLSTISLVEMLAVVIRTDPPGALVIDRDTGEEYGGSPISIRVSSSRPNLALELRRSGYRTRHVDLSIDEIEGPLTFDLERRRSRSSQRDEPTHEEESQGSPSPFGPTVD